MAETTICECTKSETIDAIHGSMIKHDERLNKGDLQFQQIINQNQVLLDSQKSCSEAMETMNKRLFVDNGTTSVQTTQDRHTQILKGMMMAITSVSLVTAGVIIKLIIASVIPKEIIGG